jgi:hypothetical protein
MRPYALFICALAIAAGAAFAQGPERSYFEYMAPKGNPVWMTSFRFFSIWRGNSPDEIVALMKEANQHTLVMNRTWQPSGRTVGLFFHHTPRVRTSRALLDSQEVMPVRVGLLENACTKIRAAMAKLKGAGREILRLQVVEEESGGKLREVYLHHVPASLFNAAPTWN